MKENQKKQDFLEYGASPALFETLIFGPVKSRRFGVSLGVNLLPENIKVCTFDCIYCECGWTDLANSKRLVSPAIVAQRLEEVLSTRVAEKKPLDSITFSGNGEPTLHPDFATIVELTMALRDKYYPNVVITVLSNATQLHRPEVDSALRKVENNILKLDGGRLATITTINQPKIAYNLDEIVERMASFKENLVIQTLFLRGEINGKVVDNTTKEEVDAWLSLLQKIAPKKVMIYPIDRATPAEHLYVVPKEELEAIAVRVRALGIEAETY